MANARYGFPAYIQKSGALKIILIFFQVLSKHHHSSLEHQMAMEYSAIQELEQLYGVFLSAVIRIIQCILHQH